MANNKFMFKTTKPTGKYKCFENDYTEIKLDKVIVGMFDYSKLSFNPILIKFKVTKSEEEMKIEPNCKWKWITLKISHPTIEDAKIWLNLNATTLIEKLNLVKE